MITRNTALIFQLDALEVAQRALPPRLFLSWLPSPLPLLVRLARPGAIDLGQALRLTRGLPALGRSPACCGACLGGAQVVQALVPFRLRCYDAVSIAGLWQGRTGGIAQAALTAEQGPQPRADVGRVGIDRLGSLAGALEVICRSAISSHRATRVAWGRRPGGALGQGCGQWTNSEGEDGIR